MQSALQTGKLFRAKTEAFPISGGVRLKGGEGENSREDGNVIAMTGMVLTSVGMAGAGGFRLRSELNLIA